MKACAGWWRGKRRGRAEKQIAYIPLVVIVSWLLEDDLPTRSIFQRLGFFLVLMVGFSSGFGGRPCIPVSCFANF